MAFNPENELRKLLIQADMKDSVEANAIYDYIFRLFYYLAYMDNRSSTIETMEAYNSRDQYALEIANERFLTVVGAEYKGTPPPPQNIMPSPQSHFRGAIIPADRASTEASPSLWRRFMSFLLEGKQELPK